MSNPFDDLTVAQKNKLFHLLQVHIYKYSKSEEILPTIRNENMIGILSSGHADILNIDYNGNEIVIEHLEKDSVFGTNIRSTNYENFQIIAKDDCEVIVINYHSLLNPKNTEHNYFNIFLRNLFDIINQKYKQTNEKLRILEQKTIRDRLLEYFEIQYRKSYLKTIELPFNLKDLADYIAVNRSAMFRELKNLKEEKFISVKGKKIVLLYKNGLL